MEKTNSQNNTVVKTTRAQRLTGKIVSDKMKDTAVVSIERFVKHPKYQKFIGIRKRFKAHNPGNTYKLGDTVVIEECRPISRDKHFKIISIG